jgi:hypothetical protein
MAPTRILGKRCLMDANEEHRLFPKTHLFAVRLWVEAFNDGKGELRMQVKHVMSGETRYFRDWSTLAIYLDEFVQRLEREEGEQGMTH